MVPSESRGEADRVELPPGTIEFDVEMSETVGETLPLGGGRAPPPVPPVALTVTLPDVEVMPSLSVATAVKL